MLIQSLGWEDPLEEDVSTHSSILSWRIPWTEEPGRLQPMGHSQTQLKQLGTWHTSSMNLVYFTMTVESNTVNKIC